MYHPILYPLFILLGLFLFTACDDDVSNTPQQPPITTVADLTTALSKIHSNSDAPGFAVSVVKDDVLIYQQAFGQADVANNQAYTNQTT
ncbi:MAG: hypothetical protein AAGA31_21125, partial [Bacteroidota bacterium]